MRVIGEEAWLCEQGAGALGFGEPALVKQPGATRRDIARRASAQWLRDYELVRRREAWRVEYRAMVARGELRPPGRRELLERLAQGHKDNPWVRAARRLLTKALKDERAAGR